MKKNDTWQKDRQDYAQPCPNCGAEGSDIWFSQINHVPLSLSFPEMRVQCKKCGCRCVCTDTSLPDCHDWNFRDIDFYIKDAPFRVDDTDTKMRLALTIQLRQAIRKDKIKIPDIAQKARLSLQSTKMFLHQQALPFEIIQRFAMAIGKTIEFGLK